MKKTNKDTENVEVLDMNQNSDKKSNKIIFIIGGAIVLVLIASVLFFVVFKDNKDELSKELENTGRNFYENYYYNQVGKTKSERAATLAKYASTGIRINLENLVGNPSEKEDLLSKFVNKNTKEKCDKEKTRVTIYPKDPYGQKDYTIEIELECGFKK